MASAGVLGSLVAVIFLMPPLATTQTTAVRRPGKAAQRTSRPSASTLADESATRQRTENFVSVAPGPFSSFSSGTVTNIPMSSSQRVDQNYLINVDALCKIDTEPVDRGGMIIAGFFEGHIRYSLRKNNCQEFLDWGAAELSEAFTFAVRKVEEQIISPSALGGLSANLQGKRLLGTTLRDTCTSGILGMAHTQALALKSLAFLSESWDITMASLGNISTARDPCKSPFMLLVGPGSSEETAAISPFLSNLKIPHISFWATSTEFNNTDEYPYLFRTVPSDDHQAKALADIIEYFGWTVVILIGGSDEIYSGRGMELIELEATHRGTFCIALKARFSARNPSSMEEITTFMNDSRFEQANVIILVAPVGAARPMLVAIDRANISGKIILGSSDWVTRLSLNNWNKLAGQNALFGLSPEIIGKVRTREWAEELRQRMVEVGRFSSENRTLIDSKLSSNPWLLTYIERALGCALPIRSHCQVLQEKEFRRTRHNFSPCDLNKVEWLPPDFQRATSLMYALEIAGQGIRAVYKNPKYIIDPDNRNCNFPPGEVLRRALRDLKIPCDEDPSGGCSVFDNEQSAWPVYTVRNWNHQTKRLHGVGTWDGRKLRQSDRLTWKTDTQVDFSPRYGLYSPSNSSRTNVPSSQCMHTCVPGQRRHFDLPHLAHCCWICIPCQIQAVSSGNNSDRCVPCLRGEAPNADQSACLVLEVQRVSFSNPLGAALTALAVLGIVVSSSTLAYFWRFRTCYLVRASDLYLTTAILTGIIMGEALSLLLLVEPTDVTCRLPPILTTPWTIMTSAGILVKTNRFRRIFLSSVTVRSGGRGKRILFSTVFQLVVIGALTVVSIAMGVLQVVVSPPGPEKIYPDSDTVYNVCTTSKNWNAVQLAYLMLLLFLCTFFAFQTRKLPDNYNEAQLVAMAAFATCVVCLGFSPAVFITQSSLRPAIFAFALVAQMWAIWTCLYAPRLVPMLRSREVRSSSKPKPPDVMSSIVHTLPSTASKSTIASQCLK